VAGQGEKKGPDIQIAYLFLPAKQSKVLFMRVELHCHSHYSRGRKIPTEGLDSPADMVRTAKKMGLDGLALTDHNSSSGWQEASQEAKKQGLLFIPAIEISSLGGHIIGLGLNEPIQAGLPPEETLERIREQGAVSVAAHPFDIRRDGLGALSLKADALEAFNSMNLDRYSNRASARFARKSGKPCVAGSDAHTKEMVGQCVNHMEAHDLDSCLKAIKAGKLSFQASYTPLGKLLPWTKQRMLRSYGELLQRTEGYYQPKRWVSQRLLHAFTSSRREAHWYWLGELGLAGARAYGLLKRSGTG
jgi:predicted metal-dependent phosphoesterase TrpH